MSGPRWSAGTALPRIDAHGIDAHGIDAHGEAMRRVAVLSRSWRAGTGQDPDAAPRAEVLERRAAVRSLAGALSRDVAVDVLVPGPRGTIEADGAFDCAGVGEAAPNAYWPAPGAVRAEQAARWGAVVVDTGDGGALALARALAPGVPVLAVGSTCAGGSDDAPAHGVAGVLDVGAQGAAGTQSAAGTQDVADGRDEGARCHHVGLYARVHPYAAERPHHELGPVHGYLLVLSDRAGGSGRPDARTTWLLTRFARRHVVVVHDAVAHVWRSRSRLFAFGVHARMDLWRLMAHAWATVDLAPGPLYGRECVESLRYGVPVVAPAGSSVEALAGEGAISVFGGTAGLLARVGALEDPRTRAGLAAAGKAVADRWYGDPAALVGRVTRVLAALEGR